MKTLNQIAQTLTSPAVLDGLTELIRSHDEHFSQEETAYHEAVIELKKVIPAPAVDEYISACQTEVIADILYAAYEGYRANLANYHSPCTTAFHRMDPYQTAVYRRELKELMGYLPA